MKYKKWLDRNIDDLNNKTIIVTGANSGIGYYTTLCLVYKNANVIMACRNLEKAKKAKENILKLIPNAKLDIIKLDLSDFNSIENFNSELRNKFNKIDILINNAGIYYIPNEVTKQRYEITMGTNFLGPYYLTSLLIDLIKDNKGTIINVSSIVHKHAKIDFNDFFKEKGKRNKIYASSKLAITSFSYYLSEVLEKYSIKVITAHPGMSATNILNNKTNEFSIWLSKLGSRFIKLFTHSPFKASLSIVKGVNNSCHNNDFYGPKIFEISGYPKKVKYSKNSILYKEKIIEVAEKLTNKEIK